MDELDDLIERLRERAGDPSRRVDRREGPPTTEGADVDAAALVVNLARSESDRQRARDGGASRRADDLVDRSTELAFLLGAPAEPGLPRTATGDQLDEVQAVLGVPLPKVLRRALAEVADGGFGPGIGLLSAREIIRVTGRCRRQGETTGGWPADRLPVADLGEGALACVVLGDPFVPVEVFDARVPTAFTPAAPALFSWLGEWASAPSAAPVGF